MLAALDALDPEVVCIEGPPEAEPVLDLAADPDMVPLIALLADDPDRPTRASFWPLAAFSPEWQALRWAQHHGRPVRFIDLPAADSLAGQDEEDGPSVRDPLAPLVAAAGYGDVERWWDDLVEHGDGRRLRGGRGSDGCGPGRPARRPGRGAAARGGDAPSAGRSGR